MADQLPIRIVCQQCGHRRVPTERWFQVAAKRLKVEPEAVVELLKTEFGGRLRCDACGARSASVIDGTEVIDYPRDRLPRPLCRCGRPVLPNGWCATCGGGGGSGW